MDKHSRTTHVIRAVNSFNSGGIEIHELLSEVCEYFDTIKFDELNDAEKKFLIYISSLVGVPQYFEMLYKFDKERNLTLDDEDFDLITMASIMYEAQLYTSDDTLLHRFQSEILNMFEIGKMNRFFLSASTSFGKTHLVYEIIRKMKYNNIVLIFPTIALLTENLDKIKKRNIDSVNNYHIQTLSEVNDQLETNNRIYIFTPERFLSFIDKQNKKFKIDFLFVDEIYKIDNKLMIDEEGKENERDVAYRLSLFQALTKYPKADILLAGPFIKIHKSNSQKYNPSFDNFLNKNQILKLDRNIYEVVKVDKRNYENEKGEISFNELKFDFNGCKNKKERVQEICDKIIQNSENVIIYCNTKSKAEEVARDYNGQNNIEKKFLPFFNHLKDNYHNDWAIIDCLTKGVGIHHGLVPKYIQKEIIELFNAGKLHVLTATTTITEGVNTTAKNVLVYRSLKGHRTKDVLHSFDAKNIAGRAGRFMEHYTGRVITLDGLFMTKLEEDGEMIRHKNYDENSIKSEIDDDMTPPEYQSSEMKERIKKIKELQTSLGIPDNIMNQYKVVKRMDKIRLYQKLLALSNPDFAALDKFVSGITNYSLFIDKDGFQIFLEVILDIVEYEKLKSMITNKYQDNKTQKEYSILFAALSTYLSKGFNGAFSFYLGKKKAEKNAVNNAMRNATDLVYNTFKYQLVKYLGVFNLMYRFRKSQLLNKDFDEVEGIEWLITKLEYNAFSNEGRLANDYGVPSKVVDYYDATSLKKRNEILTGFDAYEKSVFEKVDGIIRGK